MKNKPLAIRKLKAIPWIRSDLITALIDIIESIQKRFGNIQTAEHEEAFGIALSNALNDAKLGENGTLLISSGLLFLLVALYYNIEISSPSADAVQYKDRLLTWSEKYQITDAQIDTEQNAASNAECIEAIFNRYVRSTEQTIFMSRCFSAEYNETENAIRRAINEINNEKKTGIMLIRVDEHHEGTTGQISDRIFRDIESAGLVIADLSSGKLNVPHEIGYAMGLKKDLILVHNGTSEEAEKHIPSNIRMFEQIRFNGDYQTLQNEIKRRLIDYYRIVLRGREEKRIYTAIDLMYMLMFSSEVSQIAEFDSDEKNSESQVLSWGGASDYFTVFLSEKGFISKGAIEYSNVYSEVDTSAAHIFSHYLELGGVFPFHLSSTIFADPECWNVICDDNSVYQFTRKVDFEVNSSKIASDIAEAIDRSVEYSVIGELLQPLVCLSKDLTRNFRSG